TGRIRSHDGQAQTHRFEERGRCTIPIVRKYEYPTVRIEIAKVSLTAVEPAPKVDPAAEAGGLLFERRAMWPITDDVDLVFQVMVSDSPQEVLNAFELVQTRDHQNASAALNRRNGGPNWRGCLTEWAHAVRDDRHRNCG